MALKFAHLMSPLPHGANRHSREGLRCAALAVCVNAATHRARHYDLTPLITDVANGKPASVLHMLSSHVCIAMDDLRHPKPKYKCGVEPTLRVQILRLSLPEQQRRVPAQGSH